MISWGDLVAPVGLLVLELLLVGRQQPGLPDLNLQGVIVRALYNRCMALLYGNAERLHALRCVVRLHVQLQGTQCLHTPTNTGMKYHVQRELSSDPDQHAYLPQQCLSRAICYRPAWLRGEGTPGTLPRGPSGRR